MVKTNIAKIVNNYKGLAVIQFRESPRHDRQVLGGMSIDFGTDQPRIPLCMNRDEFTGKAMVITLNNKTLYVWQHEIGDADLVRTGKDWEDPSLPIPGDPRSEGRRTLILREDGMLQLSDRA